MNQPSHQEIVNRMDKLEDKLDKFMAEIRNGLAGVHSDMNTVKKDVAETKEIVEAWSAVKTFGRGIKWFSGTLTAIVATWLIIKAGIAAAMK